MRDNATAGDLRSGLQGDTSQGRSRILNLPAEIRIMTWELSFGGHIIGMFCDEDGRLTHGLIDDGNSKLVSEDAPVTLKSVREEVKILHGSSGKPRPK
jgi:hypothetical protein